MVEPGAIVTLEESTVMARVGTLVIERGAPPASEYCQSPIATAPNGIVVSPAETEVTLPAANSMESFATRLIWPNGAITVPACRMLSALIVRLPFAESGTPGDLPICSMRTALVAPPVAWMVNDVDVVG